MSQNIEIATASYTSQREPIQRIRRAVFQDEQGVAPELEFDGFDETAEHFLAYLNGQAVGTVRLRALDADRVKLERLAVLASARGRGLGKQLMQAALEQAIADGFQVMLIHAQVAVVSLYAKLGFVTAGDHFDEAGMPHVKMKKLLR